MPDTSKNAFEIKLLSLEETRKKAVEYMRAVSYTPSQLANNKSNNNNATINSIVSMAVSVRAQSEKITTQFNDCIKTLRDQFAPNAMIIPTKLNNAFLAIQEGLAIALYVKSQYENSSNLTTLQQRKASNGKLVGDESAEFSSKLETCTAVTLFVWASYVIYALTKDSTNGTAFSKFSGIPEIGKLDPHEGIGSVIYFLNAYFKVEGMINTEQDAIDLIIAYFTYVATDVTQRKGNFKYAESYAEVTYKLEKSEFNVSGWESVETSKIVSAEFNKVKFTNIVGNAEAKHLSMRGVGMMLAYDPVTKRNPFDAIAKYARIEIGEGDPGTGKSMIIAAIATMIEERCKWLGRRFIYNPFPKNAVSTFQGGSAENVIRWFETLRDDQSIIYMPIDDAENNLMNRSNQSVSAGVREVISVFLTMTESADSLDRGNNLIGLYTNLPGMIDPAVMSRIQRRARIDGARTHADFVDQNYLELLKYQATLGDMISLAPPENYTFLEAQKPIKRVSDLNQKPEDLITHDTLREIYERAVKRYNGVYGYDFFAYMSTEVQSVCKYFTSREERNILTNVATRLCDFDYPDLFWENPEVFFLKNYDEKVGILKELMKENMKGQDFPTIKLQETLKHMNQFIRINLSKEDEAIQKYVDEMIIRAKAQGLVINNHPTEAKLLGLAK